MVSFIRGKRKGTLRGEWRDKTLLVHLRISCLNWPSQTLAGMLFYAECVIMHAQLQCVVCAMYVYMYQNLFWSLSQPLT